MTVGITIGSTCGEVNSPRTFSSIRMEPPSSPQNATHRCVGIVTARTCGGARRFAEFARAMRGIPAGAGVIPRASSRPAVQPSSCPAVQPSSRPAPRSSAPRTRGDSPQNRAVHLLKEAHSLAGCPLSQPRNRSQPGTSQGLFRDFHACPREFPGTFRCVSKEGPDSAER